MVHKTQSLATVQSNGQAGIFPKSSQPNIQKKVLLCMLPNIPPPQLHLSKAQPLRIPVHEEMQETLAGHGFCRTYPAPCLTKVGRPQLREFASGENGSQLLQDIIGGRFVTSRTTVARKVVFTGKAKEHNRSLLCGVTSRRDNS
ncbi:hypothetical protein TWF569_011549 [Orbilia oligospora]|nr:hypothetical protein TWF569_011549 [Orbilia oligospora]KAF3133129.1 hypothetical protein TWF594_009344 [Orbilia oligospora]